MKKENRKSYPSELTDSQWKEIESLYNGNEKMQMEQKRTDKCSIVFGRYRL